MKSTYLNLVIFLLAGLFLSSCSNEEEGIYFDESSVVEYEYSSIEIEVLNLVNEHRNSLGLQSLVELDIVSSVALSHTNYMIEVGKISHDNFTERQEKLVKNANAKSVGENVAYGYSSAEDVLKAWLGSDSHRQLIESANYTHFGISTEQNNEGKYFFTQMFIKK